MPSRFLVSLLGKMEVLKRIKVVLMLLTMLLMIGHDAFPHVHSHERAEHAHNHFVCDNSKGSILDRLLENHSHTHHAHEYSNTSYAFRFVKQQLPNTAFIADWISLSLVPLVVCRREYAIPARPYIEHRGLLSIGLRAPPGLRQFVGFC